MKIKIFKYCGGRGDIVMGLPAMMLLGGGDLYIVGNPNDFVVPLLEVQPYINKVHGVTLEEWNALEYDYDMSKFKYWETKHILTRRYLEVLNLDIFGVDTSGSSWDLTKPWLFGVHPKPIADIIINDTGNARWPGFTVNWDVLKKYESHCAFIGWDGEYKEFVEKRRLNVQRQIVANALEFARIIKGSKLFIGNQSLGCTIAEGLKHPRVFDVTYGMTKEYPQSQNGYVELTEEIVKRHLVEWRPEHPNSPYI